MHAWSTKSGEIAAASSHEFERRVLPLLRTFWPDLIRPRETHDLDRYGIDLLVWSDTQRFPCVVQCKGLFAHETLVETQLPQFLRSIDSFLDSPFSCGDYVLVHNRTGEGKGVRDVLNEALKKLVTAKKAKRVHLWDRQTLIKRTKSQLRRRITEHLESKYHQFAETQKRFFLFGELSIATVPASLRLWTFRPGDANTLSPEKEQERVDVSALIASSRDHRWTLLTGYFGAGKTTCTLRAATLKDSKLLYVRCQDLGDSKGTIGTNYLMQGIIGSASLFEGWEEETQRELKKLSAPLLTSVLRDPESGFALVLDGLDEVRRYARPQGMVNLSSELADLRCPIVLTTRKEHFDATFGNFEMSARQLTREEMSAKNGSNRDGLVIELKPWSRAQVIEFVDGAIDGANQYYKQNLMEFRAALATPNKDPAYADLLSYPLLLQMSLELAAMGEFDFSNEASLIEHWVKRKIKRDLEAPREVPGEPEDVLSFIDRMMVLMEEVAHAMTGNQEGSCTILESALSGEVLSLADRIFGAGRVPLAALVTTSVLVPAERRESEVSLRFFHRRFHEFFLARYLVRRNLSTEGYPSDVVRLAHQIGSK